MAKTPEEQLEDRLIEWGDFYNRRLPGAYGKSFPGVSTIHPSVILSGSSNYSGPSEVPSNDNAEEIEGWVSDLARIHPDRAKALRDKYVVSPYKKSAQLGKDCGVSERTLQDRVHLGKTYLLGRMDESRKPQPKVNIFYLTRRQSNG